MIKSHSDASLPNTSNPFPKPSGKFEQFTPASNVRSEGKQRQRSVVEKRRENGGLLKLVITIAALGLIALSVAGMLLVTNVLNPIWYVVNAMNCLFGLLIVIA